MIKITLHTMLFFAGVCLITACNRGDSGQADKKPKYVLSDSLLKTLQIDSVMKCQIVNSLILTGKVGFNENNVARIFPMVSGIITGVNVQIGDYVKKGQTLGVIKSMEMAAYSSDLITSKTNLLIAKKNLDASEDMYKSGLLSQKDLVTAEEMYKQTEAQLTRSTQVLQINGGNTTGEYIVRAPISGFIVEKMINNNMAIRADNTNNLYTISDLKNVWVEANVYESNITKVHKGDAADVTTLSYPGRIFKGKVDQVLNVLDPTNKVMKIKVVLPNPDYALKPEMFASVTVENQRNSEALCIPSSALIFDQSQYFVLIYRSLSDVRIAPVTIIDTHEGKSYVSGDIKEGDKVIASNAILIYQAMND
jgi:cobalt-zinc-cadmium efflux system membrane fusion protein